MKRFQMSSEQSGSRIGHPVEYVRIGLTWFACGGLEQAGFEVGLCVFSSMTNHEELWSSLLEFRALLMESVQRAGGHLRKCSDAYFLKDTAALLSRCEGLKPLQSKI